MSRIASCVALVLWIVAGCAPATASAPRAAAEPPPAAAPAAPPAAAQVPPAAGSTLQALVEAARKEGSLSLVWGEGTVGGSEGVRRLAEGFNRTYGLNVNVAFTPGPAMSNLATRILQEHEADRPSTTDVYLGYGEHMAPLMRGGALAREDWTAWAPNVTSSDYVAGGGVAVAVQTGVLGITYNSTAVRRENAPRSLRDLLDPRFKGRVAGQNAASGFEQLATPELWGEQRVREYLAQFVDQMAGVIRCNETPRVASGEFDVFALDCNHGNTLTLKARGAPVEFVVATDAPLLKPLYMAVPQKSAHPAAARLWINHVLSREAQDVIYAYTAMDYHLLPGSRTAADLRELQAGVSRFEEGDLALYLRLDEQHLERLRTEFIRQIQQQ